MPSPSDLYYKVQKSYNPQDNSYIYTAKCGLEYAYDDDGTTIIPNPVQVFDISASSEEEEQQPNVIAVRECLCARFFYQDFVPSELRIQPIYCPAGSTSSNSWNKDGTANDAGTILNSQLNMVNACHVQAVQDASTGIIRNYDNSYRAICYADNQLTELARSVWPLCFFWLVSLAYVLVCTKYGRHRIRGYLVRRMTITYVLLKKKVRNCYTNGTATEIEGHVTGDFATAITEMDVTAATADVPTRATTDDAAVTDTNIISEPVPIAAGDITAAIVAASAVAATSITDHDDNDIEQGRSRASISLGVDVDVEEEGAREEQDGNENGDEVAEDQTADGTADDLPELFPSPQEVMEQEFGSIENQQFLEQQLRQTLSEPSRRTTLRTLLGATDDTNNPTTIQAEYLTWLWYSAVHKEERRLQQARKRRIRQCRPERRRIRLRERERGVRERAQLRAVTPALTPPTTNDDENGDENENENENTDNENNENNSNADHNDEGNNDDDDGTSNRNDTILNHTSDNNSTTGDGSANNDADSSSSSNSNDNPIQQLERLQQRLQAAEGAIAENQRLQHRMVQETQDNMLVEEAYRRRRLTAVYWWPPINAEGQRWTHQTGRSTSNDDNNNANNNENGENDEETGDGDNDNDEQQQHDPNRIYLKTKRFSSIEMGAARPKNTRTTKRNSSKPTLLLSSSSRSSSTRSSVSVLSPEVDIEGGGGGGSGTIGEESSSSVPNTTVVENTNDNVTGDDDDNDDDDDSSDEENQMIEGVGVGTADIIVTTTTTEEEKEEQEEEEETNHPDNDDEKEEEVNDADPDSFVSGAGGGNAVDVDVDVDVTLTLAHLSGRDKKRRIERDREKQNQRKKERVAVAVTVDVDVDENNNSSSSPPASALLKDDDEDNEVDDEDEDKVEEEKENEEEKNHLDNDDDHALISDGDGDGGNNNGGDSDGDENNKHDTMCEQKQQQPPLDQLPSYDNSIPHAATIVTTTTTDDHDHDDHEHDEEEHDELPEDLCSICLCEIEEGDVVGDIPCGHYFHKDCLKDWLVKRNECPFCRHSHIASYRNRDGRTTSRTSVPSSRVNTHMTW